MTETEALDLLKTVIAENKRLLIGKAVDEKANDMVIWMSLFGGMTTCQLIIHYKERLHEETKKAIMKLE